MTDNKKVILFRQPEPEPETWSFEDFVYLNDSNPIQNWYEEQSEEVQETLDALLKNIQTIGDHGNWSPWRGYLKGDAKEHKIWEIGFKAEGKQYRIFGVFAGRKVAILTMGCYHKQRVYTPSDAIPTAIKRAKLLKNRQAKTNARPIKLDL